MAKAAWMVRAGEGGKLFGDFQKHKCVAIGWANIGNLASATTREQIRELYAKCWPETKPAQLNSAVSTIFKFRSVLKVGDRVVTYNPEKREYLVGCVAGDYRFDPTRGEYPHIREAKWEGAVVSRDALGAASRNALGSLLALFLLNEETVEELLLALKGREEPEAEEEEKEELEQIKEDMVDRAKELIKDKILRLDADEMEELSAAILRAMGYKARVSPQGPDRGVDVNASPDGLGLEEPRIKVQVKHRPKEPTSAEDIRGFLGGLRPGDKALYVSTGGFAKDAKYEAERANIPLT